MRKLKNTTLLQNDDALLFGLQCNALASLVHFAHHAGVSPSERFMLDILTTVLLVTVLLWIFSKCSRVLFFRWRCLVFVGLLPKSLEILLFFHFSCFISLLRMFLFILSSFSAMLASILSQVSIRFILIVRIEMASWWYILRSFISMLEDLLKDISHFLCSVCSKHLTLGAKRIVEIIGPFGTRFFPINMSL